MNGAPDRRILVAAAVIGATGVAIGAFGAHGLPEYLSAKQDDPEWLAKRVGQFSTGVRYHLVHAVALLALAALSSLELRRLPAVAALMVAGTVLFSGSLYVLVLTETTWWGAVTPLGGLAWIVAWSLLAFCRPRDS